MCQAFSLFLLVYEKTHPNVGQRKIFVVASEVNTSREKYFQLRKSLTQFDALISEEYFGQISLKSGKSTYPINSVNKMGNSCKNKGRVFSLKTFSEFSHVSLKFLSMHSCRRPIKH